MVEPSIFQRMVEYASLDENDIVLDVGAGLGFLTRFMVYKCRSVLAVEADIGLAKILRGQFLDQPNAKIIEGNILKDRVSWFNKVVSIPPYQISSSLLLWLFKKGFECAVLVFQKEFASRLMASVGSRNYGWLTVLTYYYAEVELLDDVPKWMFYPQPNIDSNIIRLRPKQPRPFTLRDEEQFKHFAQSLFTQRNKKVRNAVLPYLRSARNLSKQDALEVVEGLPFLDKRPRELAPEDFGVLVNAIIK